MAESDGSPSPEPTGEQTNPAQTTQPEVPAAVEPGSYISADGTLKDGWKNLIPEDFRGRKVFDTVTDLKGVLSQLGNKDVLIARQGKVMAPPKDATPTERAMFFKELGVPDKAEDYKIEVPQELAAVADATVTGQLAGVFHDAHLMPEQAAVVSQAYFKAMQEAQTLQQQASEAAMAEANSELDKRWGAARPQRQHLAEQMVEQNAASPEDAAKIRQYIGTNPYLVDFLATIGKKFTEDSAIHGKTADTRSMTPVECQNRARELMATPGYATNSLPQATQERLTREINELYKIASEVV